MESFHAEPHRTCMHGYRCAYLFLRISPTNKQRKHSFLFQSEKVRIPVANCLTLARGNFFILWQILSKFVIPEKAHAVWIKRAELNEQSTRATIHHCLSYKYLEIHFSASDLSIRIQHIEFYFLKKLHATLIWLLMLFSFWFVFFVLCCFVVFFFHSPYFFIIVLSIIVVSFFFLSLIDWSQNRERIRSKSPFSIS